MENNQKMLDFIRNAFNLKEFFLLGDIQLYSNFLHNCDIYKRDRGFQIYSRFNSILISEDELLNEENNKLLKIIYYRIRIEIINILYKEYEQIEIDNKRKFVEEKMNKLFV
jgi:hypothetical protein